MCIKVQTADQKFYSAFQYLKENPVRKELNRVYEAAKPVLCLLKPFDKFHHYFDPLKMTAEDGFKGYKSYSEKNYRKLTKDLLDVSLSVTTLVTSCYETAFGLCLSAVRDLGINSYECAILISEGKPYLQIAIKIVNVATNCVAIVAAFYGCMEVEFISLAVLLLTELFCSINEIRHRNYLMTTSHSTMFFVRMQQLLCEGRKIKAKWEKQKIQEVVKKNVGKAADPIAAFAMENCVNEGKLQKSRDYVYIKLDEDYLTKVFNKIKENNPDVQRPSFKDKIGPHVSVIRHDEWNSRPAADISEIGKKYLFIPKAVDVIETGHKKLWVLTIEPSKELMDFRKKYAQGNLPHGHEFHVTVAQQPVITVKSEKSL